MKHHQSKVQNNDCTTGIGYIDTHIISPLCFKVFFPITTRS